jgi:Flp pilus assembly protein TadG
VLVVVQPDDHAVSRRSWGRRGRTKDGAGQRGQSLVEFSLVLPLFLLGFFGLIDGARLVYLNSTLSQAAREGARTGAVQAFWMGSTDTACGSTGGPTCPATFDAMRTNVLSAANRMMTPFAKLTSGSLYIACTASTAPTGAWTGASCATRQAGSIVSVRVVQAFQPLTPVVGQILGSVTLSGSATMTVN